MHTTENNVLKEGDQAPQFRLKADDGSEVSLEKLRGKPVVLYFFPKAQTPGCITEASEFRDMKKQFDKAGAVILGCSADSVAAQAKFRVNYKLNFPLLSDPEFSAIEAYGARRMKMFLGRSFLGIVRSTFLIDREGRVAKIWDKVRAKGHAADVLAAIEAL
jgi:peroxiredoxin Q/BCP